MLNSMKGDYNMIKFIAQNIKEAFSTGRTEADCIKAGQAKYKAYFVDTLVYTRYKKGVDEMLTAEGYAACIVN